MIHIAAVEYYNTLPFIRGLQSNSYLMERITIETADPKDCALALKNKKADLALLPVGAISEFNELFIQIKYCISSINEVGTVGIFSDKSWEEIKTIRESKSSRSSNLLLRTLNKYAWKNKFTIDDEMKIENPDSSLIIGNEAFKSKKIFKNYFDLGKLWNEFSNRPFVYAIWASEKPIDQEIIQLINNCFAKYTNAEQLKKIADGFNTDSIKMNYYFKHQINYPLYDELIDSINYFLSLNNIPTKLNFI
ncbi:MAG: hypothetical protein IT267_08215 [Saprospiraceae bacterium]|nr:hypothetical protein [Saprospiraceae bacterium]